MGRTDEGRLSEKIKLAQYLSKRVQNDPKIRIFVLCENVCPAYLIGMILNQILYVMFFLCASESVKSFIPNYGPTTLSQWNCNVHILAVFSEL